MIKSQDFLKQRKSSAVAAGLVLEPGESLPSRVTASVPHTGSSIDAFIISAWFRQTYTMGPMGQAFRFQLPCNLAG